LVRATCCSASWFEMNAACRYIHKRLNEANGWRNLSVVLSDANTPGEGEHKFMQFVREQRNRPGWNPNTVHCVYGLDADLIHLALASHEPHFYILREIVFVPKGGNKEGPDKARALAAVQGTNDAPQKKPEIAKKPFQFLKIAVLREYLELEFSDLELPFQMDPERLVDDFILMCFFVGNDFLPHMPTLDIREQGIELMIRVYRDTLPYLGGYMANGVSLPQYVAEASSAMY
jgi:5'-3' exonuclease